MSDEPPRSSEGPPDEPSDLHAVEGLAPTEAPVVSLREPPPPSEEAAARYEVESLPRGTQLGRYVLLGRLSRSREEVVYAAYDPDADRKVVLKLYDPGGDDDATAKARRVRLARQGQALAKLDHPCVEQIHEAGFFGNRVFLAAEFIDGLDVRHWMEARDDPFPWPEILRVFREAGRGLSAAHKAGIVHRDFRPSNVMMGSGGRIVVIDFGLAPELAPEDGDVEISELRQSLEAAPDDTEPVPTISGLAAYVAPEQHLSEQVDYRSDQFSFCVALYEALYGERPFSGNRPRALALAAAKHDVRPPPPGSTVPPWLRGVVLRGLSPRPDDRFASMEALLRELARDPTARRRRWVLGAALAGGLTATGATTVWLMQADQEACEGTSDAMAEVWTTERREALAASFLATERRWAERSWRYTESRVDAWAETWRDYTRLACLATRVWGDAAEQTYQMRVSCLDRNLAEVDASLEVLASVDGSMVDRSHLLAQALPDPRLCTDTETLMAVGLPDEDHREDVEALHRELAGLEARLTLGQTNAVQRELEALTPRTAATGDLVLRARAELLLGRVQLARRAPEAEATIHRAALLALEVGHRPLTLDAWRTRTEALLEQGRAVEAAALGGYVDAALTHERFGWLRTDVEIARGQAEHLRGKPAEALARYYSAIESEENLQHPDPLRLCPAWLGLADVLAERNEIDEALRPLGTTIDVIRDELGPLHPALIEPLHRRGRLAKQQGRLGDARQAFEQALEIVHLSESPSPSVVSTLEGAVGSLLAAEGETAAASLHLERAFQTLGGAEAGGRPEVFRAGLAVVRSHRALARASEARALLESMLTRPRGDTPLPDLEVAEAELLLADLQWDDGDLDSARAHAERALARLHDVPAHRARRREAEQWLTDHPLEAPPP